MKKWETRKMFRNTFDYMMLRCLYDVHFFSIFYSLGIIVQLLILFFLNDRTIIAWAKNRTTMDDKLTILSSINFFHDHDESQPNIALPLPIPWQFFETRGIGIERRRRSSILGLNDRDCCWLHIKFLWESVSGWFPFEVPNQRATGNWSHHLCWMHH